MAWRAPLLPVVCCLLVLLFHVSLINAEIAAQSEQVRGLGASVKALGRKPPVWDQGRQGRG